MEPWIAARDLEVVRGGRVVLSGVSFALRGRCAALAGANGAGKTTLMSTLVGILRPSRGQAQVLGIDPARDPMRVRANVGFMAEDAGIFPARSAVEAVAYAAGLAGLARTEAQRQAHRALEAVQMGQERYRPPAAFSAGMRQRVKLAMALVARPDALFLDEPTVGLDPSGRSALLEVIAALRDRGHRILLSTHVLRDAERLCDEIVVIEAGTVTAAGSVAAMRAVGAGTLVAQGEGLGEELGAALERAGVRVVRAGADEVVFEVKDDATLDTFWRTVAQAGASVYRLEPPTRSLEQALAGSGPEEENAAETTEENRAHGAS